MKIGNLEFKNGIALAPMAGFSDRAMRVVCHELGAEYSVTEMVSAKAVVYGDKKTHLLSRIMADEGSVGLQIFGSEPSVMAEAAGVLSEGEPGCARTVMMDINMGCPVPKIFSNGEGSALMKNPALIYDIVRSVKSAITIPLGVKLRLGVDRAHINAVECALAAESAGADLITVHGRTRVEMYMGNADYQEIEKVKKALHIPLVANGDVTDFDSYLRIKNETGADGVMIGRGAVGNPFVFQEIITALEKREYTEPTLEEKVDVALRQLRLAIEDKGERAAIPESRKQIASYLHSFRGAAAIRARINQATEYLQIEKILTDALRDESV